MIGGEDVVGLDPVERRTAMMFQSYALFPHLSVRDNVAFALRVRGVQKKERDQKVDAMIEKVQLGEFANRLLSSAIRWTTAARGAGPGGNHGAAGVVARRAAVSSR